MRNIPQYAPSFDEADSKAVADVLASGWTSEGKLTKEFEEKVASIMNYRYAISTVNGTMALVLALMAVGVGLYDTVIVPDFTFVASANAVRMVGAEALFMDIRDYDFNLDYILASKRHSARCVMPVHINGRNAIPTIEVDDFFVADAAQSLGSKVGKAQVATMSFAPNKIITTAQGGIVATDDARIAEKIRRLKDHGRLDKRDYHPSFGINAKFSDLQAALGLSQLAKLPSRIERKREIFRQYQDELKGLDIWVGDANVGELLWMQDILVENRELLMGRLAKLGIETRPFYRPLHTQPAYRTKGQFPVTEKISRMGLWLPSSPQLSSEEVSFVCDSIRKCLN